MNIKGRIEEICTSSMRYRFLSKEEASELVELIRMALSLTHDESYYALHEVIWHMKYDDRIKEIVSNNFPELLSLIDGKIDIISFEFSRWNEIYIASYREKWATGSLVDLSTIITFVIDNREYKHNDPALIQFRLRKLHPSSNIKSYERGGYSYSEYTSHYVLPVPFEIKIKYTGYTGDINHNRNETIKANRVSEEELLKSFTRVSIPTPKGYFEDIKAILMGV